MRKEVRLNIFLLIFSSLICFISGEVLIRHFGRYNREGNFYFFSRKLRPYHLAVKATREKIDEYLASSNAYMIYDSLLGWSHRPNSVSKNGLEYYNSDSLRTVSCDYPVSKTPRPGILRIAIFGDSFTRGDDVLLENTWGYYLEENLKRAGIDSEVLNFGVGGYGMDQALLYWEKTGYKFLPHLVILGFQSENVKRNVNLIRPIYSPMTGLSFSKPRYILSGDKLKLINSPTLRPERVAPIMEDMASWDLAKYEYWLDLKDYQENICLKSKFIASILHVFKKIDQKFIRPKDESSFYSLNKEPAQVTLKIIQEFKKEVELNGGKFYVVNLPLKEDLKALLNGDRLLYLELLEKIEEFTPVIHPEDDMLKEARESSLEKLFITHYSASGNRMVANSISKFITGLHLNSGVL